MGIAQKMDRAVMQSSTVEMSGALELSQLAS